MKQSHTSSGEIRVEVQSFRKSGTSWWVVGVTSKKTEDVIAATMTGLNDQTQVRGQSTTVSCTSSFLILVGRRDIVRQFPRTLLDFTFIVGLGVVLVLFSHSSHLIGSMYDTDKRAPRNSCKRVTASTDLPIDLEATTKTVVCMEL